MFSEDINNIGRCKDAFENEVSDSFGHSVSETTFDAASNCVSMMEAVRSEAEIRQTAIKVMLAEIRIII